MKRKVKIAMALVVLYFVWNACAAGTRHVEFRSPEGWRADIWIPAGDSIIKRPVIVKSTRSFLAEYPTRVDMRHFAIEERWTADSPHVATVKRGGVIQTHTPGWAYFTLRLRGKKQQLRIRVDLPMDSVVMRWAVREAQVGDTVDLFYRRYFVDGMELSGHHWTTAPQDRDRNGIPLAQHAPVGTRTGEHARDSIRFVLRRPGVFYVRSMTHGRPLVDSLRIVPELGRAPTLIRAPWWEWSQPPVSGRRPFRCYEMSLGEFRKAFADTYSLDHYAFMPRRLELDSTLVLRGRQDLGMRINAVRGNRLEIRRNWRVERDSIVMFFESKEGITPHLRVTVRLPVTGGDVRGTARQSSATADVSARRVSCDPAA